MSYNVFPWYSLHMCWVSSVVACFIKFMAFTISFNTIFGAIEVFRSKSLMMNDIIAISAF